MDCDLNKRMSLIRLKRKCFSPTKKSTAGLLPKEPNQALLE